MAAILGKRAEALRQRIKGKARASEGGDGDGEGEGEGEGDGEGAAAAAEGAAAAAAASAELEALRAAQSAASRHFDEELELCRAPIEHWRPTAPLQAALVDAHPEWLWLRPTALRLRGLPCGKGANDKEAEGDDSVEGEGSGGESALEPHSVSIRDAFCALASDADMMPASRRGEDVRALPLVPCTSVTSTSVTSTSVTSAPSIRFTGLPKGHALIDLHSEAAVSRSLAEARKSEGMAFVLAAEERTRRREISRVELELEELVSEREALAKGSGGAALRKAKSDEVAAAKKRLAQLKGGRRVFVEGSKQATTKLAEARAWPVCTLEPCGRLRREPLRRARAVLADHEHTLAQLQISLAEDESSLSGDGAHFAAHFAARFAAHFAAHFAHMSHALCCSPCFGITTMYASRNQKLCPISRSYAAQPRLRLATTGSSRVVSSRSQACQVCPHPFPHMSLPAHMALPILSHMSRLILILSIMALAHSSHTSPRSVCVCVCSVCVCVHTPSFTIDHTP